VLIPPTLLFGVSVAEAVGGWLVLCADRGEPVQLSFDDVARFVRDGAARALFRVVGPLSWLTPDRVPHRGGAPVLCVADPRVGPHQTHFLETYLHNRGVCVVGAGSLAYRPDRGIAELADDLALAVRKAAGPSGEVTVVAHGLGGLVAAYAAFHIPGLPIRRLITIACPWGGTKTAVFGRDRLAREARFAAERLVGLAPVVPTTAMWSDADDFVVPSSSAVPDGAESVCFRAFGHAELMLSSEVFRAISRLLTTHDVLARPADTPGVASPPAVPDGVVGAITPDADASLASADATPGIQGEATVPQPPTSDA
jgi:pimeloyl-ACP methyl ester carboxylesterase